MGRHLIFLFSFFILISFNECFAQNCSLVINPSLSNPVCKNTLVNFTAISSRTIKSYTWLVNGDTVGTGTSISSSVNGALIELYAVLDSCSGVADTIVSAREYIINSQVSVDYNVIFEECNQSVADIQINGIVEGTPPGTAPYTYDLIRSSGSQGSKNLYTDIPVGSYPVVITDSQGCVDTTWINMDGVVCPLPDPIQAITPNEDGINDTWIIINIQFYPENEVYIFDRWGQRVYYKKGYDNSDGWNAKYLGLDMPVSTYYYVLKLNLEKSDDSVYKGPISVFR